MVPPKQTPTIKSSIYFSALENSLKKLRENVLPPEGLKELRSYGLIGNNNRLIAKTLDKYISQGEKFEPSSSRLDLLDNGDVVVVGSPKSTVAGNPIRGATSASAVENLEGVVPSEPNDSDNDERQEEEGDETEIESDEEVEEGENQKIFTPVDANNFDAAVAGAQFDIDEDKVIAALDNYIKSLPAKESYGEKDIVVFIHEEKKDVPSLIAAGTKVLDAILYVALSSEPNSAGIFKEVPADISKLTLEKVKKRIEIGQKCFLSLVILVLIRGNMIVPTIKGAEKRELPEFIRNLFNGKVSTEGQIATRLSSTSPKKFPGHLLLKVNLESLPGTAFSRIKISIAGTRVLRYAVYASKFEKVPIQNFGDRAVSKQQIDLNNALVKANDIVATLASYVNNWKACLKLHPMNPRRSAPKGFSRKCTCAILYTLTNKGKLDMINYFREKKMYSYTKDADLMGTDDAAGKTSWPVLDDDDADFMGMTVDSVKAVFDKD
nr:TPA_asm: coat protein [Viola ophiovirus]